MSRSLALVVVTLLAVIDVAAAQHAQRSAIVGRVVDASGAPVPHASVTLTGESVLGGERSTSSGPEGMYRFLTLLPGTYTVSAEAKGFSTAARAHIVLPIEVTFTVDLRLEIAPVAQSIEVSSQPPMVDVTTAASTTVLDGTLLQNLPTARTLESLLNLAPGVTNDVAFGGTQRSNLLTVDRVSVVEPLLGQAWVPVSYNWIDSVQVAAIGASAEYGQFTGAAANAVLRSGSNRYAGLAEYAAAVRRWTGNNVRSLSRDLQQAFTPRTLLSWRDLNAQVGGPLRRDRLWFFAGAGTIDERFRPFGYGGPAVSDRSEPRGVVKLDAAATGSLMLQGFYHRDAATLVGDRLGFGSQTLETAGDQHRRNSVWNGRATWTRGTTAIEARSSGYIGRLSLDPHAPATFDGPPPRIDWGTGAIANNILVRLRDDRHTIVTAARIGHTRALFRALHDFSVGLEFESARADSFYGPPGGRLDILFDGVLQWVTFTDGNLTRTHNRRATLFVQDRFAVGRVTFEPGVRIEAYRGRVPGHGTVFRTRPVSPRVGVAWDVAADHRTVVRAHYGRYHDMALSQIYANQDTGGISPRIDAVEVAPGRFEEIGRSTDAVPAYPISARLKQSHVDQWTTGIERQTTAHVALEARYVHRRFGNFIGYVDRRLNEWTPFSVTDPGPDGVPRNGDDGGAITGWVPYWWPNGVRDLVVSNPDGAFRRYDALQVIARKRQTGRWEGQASYTWSRSISTVSGRAGNNATFGNLSPLGYGGAPGGTTSLRDKGPTRSLFDYTELKLVGWYHLPQFGGVTTGAVYRWHTGSRWHRWAAGRDPRTNYLDFVVAETPFSRQTPSIGTLDLRVEKTVRLAGRTRSAGVYVDALNLTNVGRARSYFPRSGPRFGQPTSWADPRTMRVGVRVTF